MPECSNCCLLSLEQDKDTVLMEDGSSHLCACSQSEALHIFASNFSQSEIPKMCLFSDVEDHLYPFAQGEMQLQNAILQGWLMKRL